MPRKLPPRLHLKNGRYYYVHRNTWTALSRDYQALLGHATKAMSDKYIKLETAQVVEPMTKII